VNNNDERDHEEEAFNKRAMDDEDDERKLEGHYVEEGRDLEGTQDAVTRYLHDILTPDIDRGWVMQVLIDAILEQYDGDHVVEMITKLKHGLLERSNPHGNLYKEREHDPNLPEKLKLLEPDMHDPGLGPFSHGYGSPA
jgi:hypothetical protein